MILTAVLLIGISPLHAAPSSSYDICIYGGTSAGVIAAVQAKKMGKSVILISPDKHLGGLTSGGLGFTDMGDQKTVGGLTKDYFHRIWIHYQQPGAWKFQQKEQFKNAGQHGPAFNMELEIATVFEPHVAEKIFDDLIKENGIEVVRARLDRTTSTRGVEKSGNRIVAIKMEDGRRFEARIFIDCTYEGDLMAGAGVSYTIGRESNKQYGETINGIQAGKRGNQLPVGIDPYVKKGDPTSGLLPRVNPDTGGQNGDGDRKIQAYCYRMCLTDVPENRVDIAKPPGYREEDYELVFRALEAGQKGRFFKTSALPNRKTDSNNESGISTDYIGMNYDYPEGSYATREKIAEAHKNWQLGLIWTVQNHPRVSERLRVWLGKWGLPKDEFVDSSHWSPQLYVREARRMVNDHVMTENAIIAQKTDLPVGIGSYAMDSHNVQYHVNAQNFVSAEGDVQRGPKGPYEIDYRAIVPRKSECANLLVPVCVAASHITYGSIRMESVFMILSQSAATAAATAIDEKTTVQGVPYPLLRKRLSADGQILDVLVK
ncbi:MAG: FAD-dependent oxidoreductase [Candidatus Methylacidiphilales bacterium]